MMIPELARRLAATTMFSPLPMARLLALLGNSPRRQAQAGDWVEDSAAGLQRHLILLAGAVEARRSWVAPDGQACSSTRVVQVDTGGPGFAIVSAVGPQLQVRALGQVDYLSIDSDALDDLLGWGHLGAFVLPEPHLKVFHRLPLDCVAQAIQRLTERTVAAGDVIVRQGAPGDAYYVILAGEAEVWEHGVDGAPPQLVNRLVDGDSFGEEALLADSLRSATVTMTTPGRLLVLGKADFDNLMRPPLVAEIDADLARQALQRGEAQILDCRQPDEHAAGHIPGARLLPLDRLRHDGVFSLDAGSSWIVCCRNGQRSRAAVFLLQERGIRALALTGGFQLLPRGQPKPHQPRYKLK